MDIPDENNQGEWLDPRYDHVRNKKILSREDETLNALDDVAKHVQTTINMLQQKCEMDATRVMQGAVDRMYNGLGLRAAVMSDPLSFVCGYAKHANSTAFPRYGDADGLRPKLSDSNITMDGLAAELTRRLNFRDLTQIKNMHGEYVMSDDFTAVSKRQVGLYGFTLSLKVGVDEYIPVYTCAYTPVVQTCATVLFGNIDCKEWDIAPLPGGKIGPVSFMYFVIPNYYINVEGNLCVLPRIVSACCRPCCMQVCNLLILEQGMGIPLCTGHTTTASEATSLRIV